MEGALDTDLLLVAMVDAMRRLVSALLFCLFTPNVAALSFVPVHLSILWLFRSKCAVGTL
jgi:hypothetical protein